MDIVLVDSINLNSTNNIPQLGLVSLYQILSSKFSVEIVDFDFLAYKSEFKYSNDFDCNIMSIVNYLINIDTPIYSFYTISNSYPLSLIVAEKVKMAKPNAIIIFGGPQATLTHEETLKNFSFIDVIGRGEGEKYILKLVETLLYNYDMNKVDGISYRLESDVKINPSPPLLTSEELSELSYLSFKGRSIYTTEAEVVAIEAGRGCPFKCTFCATSMFWKNNFRLRNIDVLIKEIEQLHNNFNTKHVDMLHDHFTVNKNHLDNFCNKLIEKNFPVTWGCSSRIDNLTYDSIDLLKKSKCRSIFIGIETGSQNLQKIINKNINLEKAFSKIEYLVSSGIDVTVSFIYGFFHETLEDFRETIKYMERLYGVGVKKIQLHKLMPLPQTKEYHLSESKLFFDKNDIDLSIHNEGVMSEEIYSMIKKYPAIFSQFYTFESEVRNNYKRFDTFINFFTSITNNSKLINKLLLEKYGLEKLYLMFEDQIIETYKAMNNVSIEEFYNYLNVPALFKKLLRYIIDTLSSYDDLLFKNVAEFEYMLLANEYNVESVYEFDFDVLKIYQGQSNNIYNKIYLTFTENKNTNRTKVTKVSVEKLNEILAI